jgi:hypothetical protein
VVVRREAGALGYSGANAVTGLKYADHLRDAEFSLQVKPNQGAGAAAQRIEAVRRIFPKVWFNEKTTEAGIKTLDDLLDHIEKRRLFAPWGSPGILP